MDVEAGFGELVDNAAEHTDKQHSTVHLSHTRESISHGTDPSCEGTVGVGGAHRVIIRVADNGPGIPQGVRSVILEGQETQLQHGDGLGIWLVDWVTTLLGGEIAFDCDRGTTASLTFPLVDERRD